LFGRFAHLKRNLTFRRLRLRGLTTNSCYGVTRSRSCPLFTLFGLTDHGHEAAYRAVLSGQSAAPEPESV
jgi:hypothetical protein